MDKYEYKVRADEINALIAEGKYAEAVKIADTIDWRRVKSVMMLCKISDLYKINRRYQESKDILLLAYEKHPEGRLILYSLCELCIKLSDNMDEYVQAVEYYKEFVQVAPNDTGRYILQYRLYEAQDVSLEERIAVLEEFKKRDYREKWAYELAYLYHRIGLTTKCVEECDEMFLWFGEGRYVIKALELKKLHEPLNADQQEKYNLWMQARETKEEPYEAEEAEEDDDTRPVDEGGYEHEEIGSRMTSSEVLTTELPEVKTVDVGQYNTINLQMALAESMREILDEEDFSKEALTEEPVDESAYEQEEYIEEAEEKYEDGEDSEVQPSGVEEPEADAAVYEKIEEIEDPAQEAEMASAAVEEPKAVPAGYSEETETAGADEEEEPVQEEDEEDLDDDAITKSLIAPLLEETIRLPDLREVEKKLHATAEKPPEEKAPTMDTDNLQEISAQIVKEDTAAFDARQILEQMKQETQKNAGLSEENQIPGARTGVLTPLNTKPSKYDNILAQEYDGQISLVVPETERVEKQITGQLSIEDIMAEWEEIKKTNEQKRMEDVRQRILQHTGNLFADFDEATKNGLLEELERAFVAAIMKDSGKKPAIRKVILPDDEDKKISPPEKEEPEALSKAAEAEIPREEETDEAEEPEAVEEFITEDVPEETVSVEPEAEDDIPEEKEHQESDAIRERELTEEEKELFGEFIHHRKTERQLIRTLDNMSLAPYTGNVLITGEEEESTLTLAKSLIREMQLNDSNFSGKVAKISSAVLNKKDVAETFGKLDNGALIIEKASRLKPATTARMVKALDKDNMGLLVLMIDQKQDMNQLLAENPSLNEHFNLRVDVEALDDEALVAYAKQYAEEMEYSIDEFGILALHTRIADRQTSDHEVNMAEVRELVDEAIYYANKKTPGHFMDILLAKRYDEDDMIILREKDFMHY